MHILLVVWVVLDHALPILIVHWQALHTLVMHRELVNVVMCHEMVWVVARGRVVMVAMSRLSVTLSNLELLRVLDVHAEEVRDVASALSRVEIEVLRALDDVVFIGILTLVVGDLLLDFVLVDRDAMSQVHVVNGFEDRVGGRWMAMSVVGRWLVMSFDGRWVARSVDGVRVVLDDGLLVPHRVVVVMDVPVSVHISSWHFVVLEVGALFLSHMRLQVTRGERVSVVTTMFH
mmetsp:Transcript_16439/g.20817  ORF Transcript_16439/g.20817 Transcript_16439/m.20817 type:complete len:232 (-) Transcript_16439:470-1165(-)